MSRAEEGRIELQTSVQPLTDLVEPAIRQARHAYDTKGVTLTVRVDDVPVRADPQRVAQILGNLLTNALRHTPRGDEST